MLHGCCTGPFPEIGLQSLITLGYMRLSPFTMLTSRMVHAPATLLSWYLVLRIANLGSFGY
jgi:hypothetical protein